MSADTTDVQITIAGVVRSQPASVSRAIEIDDASTCTSFNLLFTKHFRILTTLAATSIRDDDVNDTTNQRQL